MPQQYVGFSMALFVNKLSATKVLVGYVAIVAIHNIRLVYL